MLVQWPTESFGFSKTPPSPLACLQKPNGEFGAATRRRLWSSGHSRTTARGESHGRAAHTPRGLVRRKLDVGKPCDVHQVESCRPSETFEVVAAEVAHRVLFHDRGALI